MSIENPQNNKNEIDEEKKVEKVLSTPEERQKEIDKEMPEEEDEKIKTEDDEEEYKSNEEKKVEKVLSTPEERQKEIDKEMPEEEDEKIKTEDDEEEYKSNEEKIEEKDLSTPEERQKEIDKVMSEESEEVPSNEVASSNEAREEDIKLITEDAGQQETSPAEDQETQESIEQTLEEARDRFVRLDNQAEKWAKVMKRPKAEFAENTATGEDYTKAKEIYLETLVNHRKNLLDNISETISESKKQEEMEQILRDTIAEEAINLNDAKTSVKLESKEDSSLWEQTKRVSGKVTDWYRRLPLRYKIGASVALLGVSAGAGAVGGATGAAIVTGAFVGSGIQRVLGGAATAVGLEGLIKKSQEKESEKEVVKEFTDGLENRLKNRDEEMDNKLFEILGRKNGEKIRRYVLAGSAGVLVGTGAVGKAMGEIIDFLGPSEAHAATPSIPKMGNAIHGDSQAIKDSIDAVEIEQKMTETDNFEKLKNSMSGDSQAMKDSIDAVEIEQKMTEDYFKETVESGDSVWSVTEDKLKNYFGEKFENLGEAKQTHLIDQIKDKIAENPDKFGLEAGQDIDNLKVGQELDFSKFMGGNALNKMFESADSLSEADMDSILDNNDKIEAWVKANPDESLTSEKVNEILNPTPTSTIEGADISKPDDVGGGPGITKLEGEVIDKEILQGADISKPDDVGGGPGVTKLEGEVIDKEILQGIFEKYDHLDGSNTAYVENTLNMIESSGVVDNSKEFLKDLYFSDWDGEETTEQINGILKNMFGDDYSKVDGHFSGINKIARDNLGNIHVVLDQVGWLGNALDAWDITFTPSGEISADGPLLWGVEEKSINADSLEEVKNKILSAIEEPETSQEGR